MFVSVWISQKKIAIDRWRLRYKHGSTRRLPLVFVLCCLCLLSACTLPGQSSGPLNTGQARNEVALNQLSWCDKPSMIFRDQASKSSNTSSSSLGPANGTPTNVKDWSTFKANAGFTIFLPATLPEGTCLYNVTGSLRDTIFGSNFTITYMLVNQDVVSFSQAPLQSKNNEFQCSVSQDGAKETADSQKSSNASQPLQMCNGVHDQTSVVFSAHGDVNALRQLFQSMQPEVDWMPASK